MTMSMRLALCHQRIYNLAKRLGIKMVNYKKETT